MFHYVFPCNYFVALTSKKSASVITGVTLAQLRRLIGQADVDRFKPHLRHNWSSCGVFLVKSRHFGLHLAQTIKVKLAISLSGWLGRYTDVEYLQSLYLKRRGQLLFQV